MADPHEERAIVACRAAPVTAMHSLLAKGTVKLLLTLTRKDQGGGGVDRADLRLRQGHLREWPEGVALAFQLFECRCGKEDGFCLGFFDRENHSTLLHGEESACFPSPFTPYVGIGTTTPYGLLFISSLGKK